MKRTKTWYYEFIFAGRLIKEPSKSTSKTVAKEAERQRRRELETWFNGLADSPNERVLSLAKVAEKFLVQYRVRQPKSAKFAEHALRHVSRIFGQMMLVDITDKMVQKYQTERLKEFAAPKTINEEVGFLLRLLNVAQAGAIRARLRQTKKLKLKVAKTVGKACSAEEKDALLKAAREAPKSKAIYMATMLALHAGLRDKEIRTLQWRRIDLSKRLLTVGETKTDAGTGRTIPMNDGLHAAFLEYADWFTDQFGKRQPEWYVFPFGKPRPNDPTRAQTSLKTAKTAWPFAREKANVNGRFHNNRHTFVTDLAESGAGDEVIRDMAGHVSRDMLKHYSHIRTEAKRRAVEKLSSSSSRTSENFKPGT